MALSSVNLARISFNQRVMNLQESLRSNQNSLFEVQNQLATGLRFLRASDDPLRAASAANLDRRLSRLDQVTTNVRNANSVLTEVESAAQSAVDLFSDARALAVQSVGDTITPEERQSLMTVVDSMLEQLVAVGNRKYLNTYLFSGQQATPPFELKYGGVLYNGDEGQMQTIVENDLSQDAFTVPGLDFFGAVSAQVSGADDLNPALTADTRLCDLNGAAGRGVELGRVSVTVSGTTTQIDLTGAATMGDVLVRLNTALPGGVQAALGTSGIVLTQPSADRQISIDDVAGGSAARDLGLAGDFSGIVRPEVDIDPKITALTKLDALQVSGGLDLSSGFIIRNGGLSATIDLSGATTVEDALNTINGAGVGVWARIADDGSRLEIRSRLSGADLTIEENGGRTATGLGLRSMYAGTRLADLNDGGGVQMVSGADLRVTTADGHTVDVDLDGAQTLNDVLKKINFAGAGVITADLAAQGNGLRITDLTTGGGQFSVTPLNDSPALRGLGLDGSAVGNVLVGRDVHPIRVDSPFTGLLELRSGMEHDDRQVMQTAGARIDRVLESMQRVQGQVASQAQMMSERADRVDTETSATKVMLSDVKDVDFSEAAVHFQQLQLALQANLTTASHILKLSLLDYLG